MTTEPNGDVDPHTQLSIHAAMDRMPEAMVIFDRLGALLFANAQAERQAARFLGLLRQGLSFADAGTSATRALRPDPPEADIIDIARRLARLHGGDVTYGGGPRGAVFSLRLHAWPPLRSAKLAPPAQQAAHGLTALIVDDDAVNRAVTGHMLDMMGLTLREASSGAEALAAILHATPDLLLLDMQLQDMHGSDVLRYAAALPDAPEIPVLSGEAGIEALTLPMGARAALTKPPDLARLRSAIAHGPGARLRGRTRRDAVDRDRAMRQSAPRIRPAATAIGPA